MNIGKLNRKITIQSPPTSKDAGGELTGTWSTFATPWSKITDKASTEAMGEGSEVMTTVRSFVIRYRSGITNAQRIYYDSKYWQIVGVLELAKNEYLEIQAIVKTNW
jgi:SPP1 family predicted phage head-tail adaptor